ncbi:DUF1062 domain-containing protein [Klebsiella quasivariicola]|nr:DUF1062 domain-containing protein [Klebsiella quasivariicola]SLN96922.1 Uncharacterized protein conserved in bacteria [Klebsiella quasivariicola]VGP84761.1 hypothetical protein SB6094_01553 [Klebsiella quasivariicola]
MTVTWTVTPVGYQHIAKRCPACNVKRDFATSRLRDFAPSGAIRVNSQKKLLDIWSIYKCTRCDYTWNIALFSRLHVSKINRELLQRLLQNDAAMVHYYAADLATLKRNRAEPSGQPDFRIQEQWSVTLMACPRITVRVRVSQPFRVSLLSILKKQLKLSTAEIRWLVATGHIEGISLKQLKTKKLKAMEYRFQLAAETLYARRRITLSLCGR